MTLDTPEAVLERLAEITAERGFLFMQPADGQWHDDWGAALAWIERHLSYTPEQSAIEQFNETINDWRESARQKDRIIAQMQEALLAALPYVEDVLSNPEQLACFKRGVVQRHAEQIRAAIDLEN